MLLYLEMPPALLELIARLMLHPVQRKPEFFTEQELDSIDRYLTNEEIENGSTVERKG